MRGNEDGAGIACFSAIECNGENAHERTKQTMSMDQLQQFINLRSADIDPELFAAALAVQYIRRLIANGGSAFGHLDLEGVCSPQDLERFLVRAVETAQKNTRFEHEWLSFD